MKAVRAALAAAEIGQLDLGALMTRYGIGELELEDPDMRYSHALWIELWNDVERLSGEPGIGLRTAAALPMGHWDVLDYLIASSATVGEGLHRLERYLPLLNTGVEQVSRLLRRAETHRAGLVRSLRNVYATLRCQPLRFDVH